LRLSTLSKDKAFLACSSLQNKLTANSVKLIVKIVWPKLMTLHN